MTTLNCPGCGERCGTAKLLDDDVDLVHITTYNVKRPGPFPNTPIHVTRGRTLRLSDPDGWPLTWRCEVCETVTVELTRGRARRVGSAKRIVLASIASDT